VAVAQLPRASVPCDNWHLTRVLLLLLFVLLLAMKWCCTQANIITDLLDFAELKGGSTALRATEFDIDEAVRSAVRMFTTTVRSKVTRPHKLTLFACIDALRAVRHHSTLALLQQCSLLQCTVLASAAAGSS
jgi:hypothetical protein